MSEVLRLQEKLRILSLIPIFANLPKSDKVLIASVSSLPEYKKGGTIYKERDPADAFYCVVTGRVKVYIAKDGKMEDLEYLNRGRYFGIISLLTGETHSVTAQAVNDSMLLKIVKSDFDVLLERIPRLAIHFSQTLSRRLKRKDSGEKKVFESTIISVFSPSSGNAPFKYALNLALSLKMQAHKDVILLSLQRKGEDRTVLSEITSSPKPLHLDSPFFDESIVNEKIFKYRFMIDIIPLVYEGEKSAHLTPLLSYLTKDYSYVVVDMQAEGDKAAFLILQQSDTIHFITPCDEDSLRRASGLMRDMKNESADIERKIKFITIQSETSNALPFPERKEILAHEIFATLPVIDRAKNETDTVNDPIVISCPDCEYSKAIRRISRQLGDCLIGLALGCGAAMGLGHIGILKVIERENIPIDVVAGTSMGALIGALWAFGKRADEIGDIMSQFKKKIATFRLADLAWPAKGLIKGREAKRFLVSQFGNKTFYDLKMPLKIITCDIETREEVVLEEGNLADAVMASVAIPGVFEPVKIANRLLVDGGIINPLPTNVLIASGVANVIAVNALPSPEDIQKSTKKVTNIFDIIVNSIQASEYLLAEASCQNADITMRPILPTADWYEFYELEKIVERGEEEAIRYLPQLRELAK